MASKRRVIFFSIFSLLVVGSNLTGVFLASWITIFDLFLIVIVLFGQALTTFYILVGFEQFDRKNFRIELNNFPKRKLPSVDIFLPSAGESLKVLERTWKGVEKIDYPIKLIRIYVLDDKGRAEVKQLSKKFKFRYLSRPNKGEFKKAGNLKFGFDKSKGDYILILDADFKPNPEIIKSLLLYHLKDNSIGIVQSPQDFIVNKNEDSYIQLGDRAIQDFFYKIIEVARNKFNASICVGTNALYRRESLKKAGGFFQIEHSEDSHTGINIIKAGYKIQYLPVVLAKGYCPSDYNSLFKQRTRWCQGSLNLAKSEIFRKSDLNPMARLCYFSGFYYYLNSFILLSIPFHTLYLLYSPYKSSVNLLIFFIPNIIYLLVSMKSYYYPRFHFSVLGNQFFFNLSYAYVILKKFVFQQNEEWQPTGGVIKRNQSYIGLISFSLIYILIYWILTFILISRLDFINFADIVLMFWVLYNITTHVSYLIGLIKSERSFINNLNFLKLNQSVKA